MPTEKFSDQQVVAAFNSCIDLQKYATLPSEVKTRICALLSRFRIKPVCFTAQVGLGLRVFIDPQPTTDGGDEVVVMGGEGPWQLDLDGVWLRCPPVLWTEIKKVEELLVMDERGRQYVHENSLILDKDPLQAKSVSALLNDPDEDDEDEDDEDVKTAKENVIWSTYRNRAKVFRDRGMAERLAGRIKGFVVRR